MKNFLLISGGNILRQLATFAGQLYVVSRISSASFGELTFAFSLYFMLTGLADFGTRLHCWRSVLQQPIASRLSYAGVLWWRRLGLVTVIVIPINVIIYLVASGMTATLLHLYTLGILFNQVAFDWYLLSLNKTPRLFLFNASSGILYLLLLVATVHNPDDVYWVPIAFALSYAIPGTALLAGHLRRAARTAFRNAYPSSVAQLPRDSYELSFYDILQRVYSMFIFVVAWRFYNEALLGDFRVAHLIYAFASTLAIYMAAGLFNKSYQEFATRGYSEQLQRGTAALLLLVPPLSVAGALLAPAFLRLALMDTAAASAVTGASGALTLLLAGLTLPVLANFWREILVSSNNARLSATSYAATIGSASLLLVLYHPMAGPEYLASVLLIGELVGLSCIALLIRRSLWPPGAWRLFLLAAGFSLLTGLVLLLLTRLAPATPEWDQTVLPGAAFALLYTVYILALRRHSSFFGPRLR